MLGLTRPKYGRFLPSANNIPWYFCHRAGPTPTMLGQSRLPRSILVTCANLGYQPQVPTIYIYIYIYTHTHEKFHIYWSDFVSSGEKSMNLWVLVVSITQVNHFNNCEICCKTSCIYCIIWSRTLSQQLWSACLNTLLTFES